MNNSYCLSCHSGLNRQLSELMQWLCRGRSTALLKNLSVAVLSVISTLHASSLKNPFCLHPPEDIPAEYRECYPHAVPAGSAARGTSIHKMLLFILWRCSSYWQKVPFTLVLYTTAIKHNSNKSNCPRSSCASQRTWGRWASMLEWYDAAGNSYLFSLGNLPCC